MRRYFFQSDKILGFLDCRTLVVASQVSQAWNYLISSSVSLWQNKIRELGIVVPATTPRSAKVAFSFLF
jgi:hypothetical protein